ncbi:DUF2642 domain-containing protein [Paenibacillus lignilyticus]|uniref:DUF2642 domain-containing protein n=1 Tax=Paenibacillus lignilyticus TaxID=1172615 RepID=A0ABS5CGM1_9BACL|nr:DUF2642 domain-containing protein [Paenibacillus lignilyticus]MBP3964957.1 DUF2642 domain-containing protein [Paenibacillus lignilyticus]
MNQLIPYLAEKVNVEVTGKKKLAGKLVDVGPDILVLYHEERYMYIPTIHVHNLNSDASDDNAADQQGDPGAMLQPDSISLMTVLQEAKGMFVEICISGSKPMYGFLQGVMNDYLVICSPIYNALFVSLRHLKWLIPYPSSHLPYARSADTPSMKPLPPALSRSFEERCREEEGNMVVIDLGGPSAKLGVIKKVGSGFIDFIDAGGSSTMLNMQHIKSIYAPK